MKKFDSIFKLVVFLVFSIFLFIFTACGTMPKVSAVYSDADFQVVQIIEKDYRIISFPLDFSKIQIVYYPTIKDVKSDGWYKGIYTRDFGVRSKSFVAFNTAVFEVKNIFQHMGFSRKSVGIYKVEGQVLSPPIDYFACLCFKDEKVWIAKSQEEESVKNADYAFGGFFKILENGELIPWNDSFDVRMSVGLNKDSSRFYILTGKNLSFNQCALILKEAGCTEAMEFDGGSSTQIYIKGEYQTPFCVPPGASLGFTFLN